MTVLSSLLLDKERFAFIPLKFDEETHLSKAHEKIRSSLGNRTTVAQISEKDRQYWISLAWRTYRENLWEDRKLRELKNIAWCLFDGAKPLIDEVAFLKAFLNACTNKIRKSLCSALIGVYLVNYGKPFSGISFLGQWLAGCVQNWDWPWKDREKTFSLFSSGQAPALIADAILSDQETIKTIFDTATLQSSGMARAAFAVALERYTHEKTHTLLQHILSWAAHENGEAFSYPELRTVFIDTLLLPWIDAVPDGAIRGATQNALLGFFRDPRIDNHAWQDVSESALQVMRRWLAGRSLEQFLTVVEQLAVAHQWQSRKQLWMGYYKKGVVDDAWVVFDTNGINKSLQLARQNDDSSWRSFGRMSGNGDKDHAVLILKIGDLTISDFSHNGKCRIYEKGNRNAPEPYLDDYSRYALMNDSAADFYKAHQGYWQFDVTEYIRQHTGVSR